MAKPVAPRYDELMRDAVERLAGRENARLDAELLLAQVAGVPRSAVIAFPERRVDAAAAERFVALIERRRRGEPLAYLVGTREFYALALEVGPDVLVPRPETEHLVDVALERLAGRAAPAVLDLGTGSGALALALKRQRPDAAVTGVDASRAALDVARRNARRLGLEVEWLCSDWFSALAGRRFACIVCNPPYLDSDDPHFSTGIRFEPRAALDGGRDGLDAIRQVLDAAPAHLAADGALLIEHGYAQQDAVVALAERVGFATIDAGRDLAGHPRYVVLSVKARAAAARG